MILTPGKLSARQAPWEPASAVLLADVVRQLRGTLILVLATHRESAASGDTSARLLPRLSADANTERVDLGGLPAGAVGDMLLAAGLPASADQAGEVHSETGGNPFLVRELARMLAFEEAVRLYRQALSVGEGEIGDPDRSRLELALAVALHRSGDLLGSQETAAGVGRRAERRRDRGLLARTALVMEATGVPEWDGEICRICEQALAGEDLPDGLRARVSSRYAQALVYRGEYDRAAQVSRDVLAVAGSAGAPMALVDALRARQLACCAPDGVAERAVLASRMLEAADAAGSAWLEMWGRLWRIDTLFETGQLRSVRRELADLESCVERLPGPLAQWHFVQTAATLALATGRFTEATRLAADAFKVFSDMGHPVAFGGCSVILGQAGLPGIPPGHHPARGGHALHQEQRLNRPGVFGSGVRATATGAGRSCDRGGNRPGWGRGQHRGIFCVSCLNGRLMLRG